MRFLIAILLLTISFAPAEARHHQHRQHHHHVAVAAPAVDPGCNVLWPCEGVRPSPRGERVVKALGGLGVARPQYAAPRHIERTSGHAEVIGGRPAGCPHAFCGCSASLYLFGKIVPELNLAANWGKFPTAEPAPGMAAYRAHHVFVIMAVNSDGTVIAHDGNSGRHLTRVHTVSLRGYRVVNPHA